MSKTVALFPAHPAQLWLLLSVKSWIEEVDAEIEFKWFFRDKDVTLSLANSLGLEGVVVSKAASGLIGNAIELCANVVRCVYYTRKFGIDLWLTKYGCGNIAARLVGKKSISFNDDDEDVVPLIARTSYPYADVLLFPVFTRNRRYASKSVYYSGLHENAYLKPVEDPDSHPSIGEGGRYALIRISALTAHHDVGHAGIDAEFLDRLVSELQKRDIKVYISSEANLPERFSELVRRADVSEIHDFLAGASFYVGDSQTMAIEASLLGVPTLRISDFNNLSVINHLEGQGLIKSFLPGDASAIVYLASFLDNYEQQYIEFRQRVGQVRRSFEDTREVFGEAVLDLLRG